MAGAFTFTLHNGMHPMLLPLTVSNPGDMFNPADPWANDLNPDAQARQFNRQFGFVMAATSDLLPVGQSIRIRHVSSDPGLRFHAYRPNQMMWNPIFGTDGSSDTLDWNMAMFHPSVSYSGPNDMAMATFVAFVVDGSGDPVEGVEEEFDLMWTVVRPLTAKAPMLAEGSATIEFELPMPWAGSNCTVRRTSDFESWTEVGTVNAAPAGANTMTDNDPPGGQAFYSVEIEPPPTS